MKCLRCGKEFEPKEQSPSHLKRNPPKYCSHPCGKYARLSRVTLTCRQCGKGFERKRYMVDWSQDRGPFCGFRCYGQWQKQHTAGPANPNYSPDAVKRLSWNHREARRLTIQRDQGKCVLCGSDQRLHVHHIADPDCHELDNLETVCASCHRKRHPMPHQPDGKFASTH